VTRDGSTPLLSQDLHRDWRRVLALARVRYRRPEQLRHTFASAMLSRNAPLLYVQQQGGWRSAAVLLRVYARWIPQDFESVLAQQAAATQAQPARRAGEQMSIIQHLSAHPAAGLNFQKESDDVQLGE